MTESKNPENGNRPPGGRTGESPAPALHLATLRWTADMKLGFGAFSLPSWKTLESLPNCQQYGALQSTGPRALTLCQIQIANQYLPALDGDPGVHVPSLASRSLAPITLWLTGLCISQFPGHIGSQAS